MLAEKLHPRLVLAVTGNVEPTQHSQTPALARRLPKPNQIAYANGVVGANRPHDSHAAAAAVDPNPLFPGVGVSGKVGLLTRQHVPHFVMVVAFDKGLWRCTSADEIVNGCESGG